MKSPTLLAILPLLLLNSAVSNFSAFGSGTASRNYTLDLIKEFTPNSNNDEVKCKEIPGLGFPIKAVSKFNSTLASLFNPNDPNIFVRMFFYKNETVNKDREYKYGLEVRTFTERVYLVVKLKIGGKGNSHQPEETLFMTKNAQMLPAALGSSKIDLGNVLGCGDLKTLFAQARGM